MKTSYIILLNIYTTLLTTSSSLSSPNEAPTCGTLVSRLTNDPTSPSTPGFDSGIYIDGSKIYPGVGIFPNCPPNGDRASRISSKDANAYSPCDIDPGADLVDSVDSKYFLKHPNMHCVQGNMSNIASIPGAIFKNDFYFLRFNFSYNNQYYQQIGFKYDSRAYYWSGNKTEYMECGNFEVLVCDGST